MGTAIHLCIDAVSYTPSGKGAARYTYELLRSLYATRASGRVSVFVRAEAFEFLQGLLPEWSVVGKKVSSAQLWYGWRLPREVRKVGGDLTHVLGEAGVLGMSTPFAMAVHELPSLSPSRTAITELKTRIARQYFDWAFPRACKNAAILIALSESTREDLRRLHSIPLSKIVTAHPGVSREFFDVKRAPSSAPYVLMFATGDPRELPEAGLRAFAAEVTNAAYQLRIAGKCPSATRVRLETLASALGVGERVQFLGFIPDTDLPSLYANAVVFMELTRYEGFGLQVAEAMAAGTVVIATDIPAVHEVVGSSECLVPVHEIELSVPRLLSRLIQDVEYRLRIQAQARARAQRFTWMETANITWAALTSAIQKELRR